MSDCNVNDHACCDLPKDCGADGHGCGDTAADKLKALVGQQIDTSVESVRANVTKKLVDAELEKRTELVLKGLAKRDDLHKQLSGLTPDQVGVDDKGNEVCKSYSQARYEARKKLAGELSSLNAALEDALTGGKYCKLKHTLGSCGK